MREFFFRYIWKYTMQEEKTFGLKQSIKASNLTEIEEFLPAPDKIGK